MNTHLLKARQASEVLRASDPWMFAPGGVHTITCAYGSGAANVTLRIDESTVPVLNAALAKLNATHAPQRAFIDKEHDQQAGATAWPQRFEWREQPQAGVYVVVEPSALGKSLVDGKVMRAFSPSFLSDAELPSSPRAGTTVRLQAGKRGSVEHPARMIGLDFPAVGTLTNDPAFRQILPLWAKNAGAPSGTVNQQHTQNSMKLTPEQKAALQARKTELENQLPALRATQSANPTVAFNAEAVQAAETELEAASTKLSLHAMAERTEELENALRAQRAKDADEAINDAIRRGAIAAKDEALQATWKAKCTEDPSNIVLLASMRGSPALSAPTPKLTLGAGGIVISREDSVTVLKAYAAERDPRKKAAIYARDLSKRIKDGEDLPLHATNTLGTVAGELIVQNALELLLVSQPILGLISTDFSGEAVKWNQEINSRIVTIPTTTAYNTSTGYADENTTTTDVPVTINTHKSCQVSFNVQELAGTARNLFAEQAPAMSYAIGKDFVDAVLAKILVADFTNITTEALIDFDRETVIGMAGALSDRGVPPMGRFLMLKGNYHDKLFSDSAIVNLAANQQSQIITGGRLPMIHDFSIVRTPTLPTTGNLTGFGGSRSSLVIAGRVPGDYTSVFPGVDAGGRAQLITDPSTGITVQMVQFINHTLGTATQRVAYMYGAAKGQVAAGQFLRSAA
jgi:hypothetical protein